MTTIPPTNDTQGNPGGLIGGEPQNPRSTSLTLLTNPEGWAAEVTDRIGEMVGYPQWDGSPPPRIGPDDEAEEQRRWNLPRYLVTAGGLAAILENSVIRIRYNRRANRAEVRRPATRVTTAKWIPIDDPIEDNIRSWIAYHYAKNSGKNVKYWKLTNSDWRQFLNAYLYYNQIDPFMEWLKTLPQWDGERRVEHLLHHLFNADIEDELAVWTSKYLFLAAIQRSYQPGCKLDQVPVLKGRQGIGKSALVRSILPKEHAEEWHNDNLTLDRDSQKQVEAILGRVLVEISEMAGSTRGEIEHIKAFITRQVDQIRLAYRRNVEYFKRCGAFIATTDRDEPLPNDPAGNRRWVVVELTKSAQSVESYMDQTVTDNGDTMREMLWAETLHMYLTDVWETAALPRELLETQRTRNEQYRSKNIIYADAIDGLDPEYGGGTINDIAAEASIIKAKERLNEQQAAAVGKELRARGWTKGQEMRDRVRRVIWRPPGR